MISVQEVVTDPDMIAPHPYTIFRSQGQFIPGGFEPNNTIQIPTFGPVQQASNKEIQMLAEADRVGSIRSFWNVQPIFLTRGTAPVPGVYGEVPTGSGVDYTLSTAPPSNTANVYVGGVQLQGNGFNYTISGTALTFNSDPSGVIYVTWEVTVTAGQNAADIIQYGTEQYRALQSYFDPGGGYWKCLATRMAAA